MGRRRSKVRRICVSGLRYRNERLLAPSTKRHECRYIPYIRTNPFYTADTLPLNDTIADLCFLRPANLSFQPQPST